MNRRNFLLMAAMPAIAAMAATVAAEKATTVFSVHLHCQDCVNKVMKNIAFEKGVTDLKPDLEKKQVTVTYRTDKTNISKLVAAFKKIGLEAKDIDTKLVK